MSDEEEEEEFFEESEDDDENEESEEGEEKEESVSETDSDLYIVTKKNKVEEEKLEKEKEIFKNMFQTDVPMTENGLRNYFYDLRTILLRFIEQKLFFTLDPDLINAFYLKICFYLTTTKAKYETEYIDSIRDDIDFEVLKSIIISLSYLNRIKNCENFELNEEIPSLFEIGYTLVKLRRDSLYFIFDDDIKKQYTETFYYCFYYISNISEIEAEDENYDQPLFYEKLVSDDKDLDGKLVASDYFIKVFEIFFYHTIRTIFICNPGAYIPTEEVIWPPEKNLFKFLSITDDFLLSITQKEIMDSITSKLIPDWLLIEQEVDYHKRMTKDRNLPPPLVVLQSYRRPDLTPYSSFIKSHNGLSNWWQTFNSGKFKSYYSYEDNTYEPVYEEATRHIYGEYFEDVFNLNISSVVIKKEEIKLPLTINDFYNCKYPRIVQTARGYCLFDVLIKKFIPYKTFLCTLFMWIFSISNRCFNQKKNLENNIIDFKIETSLSKIKKFVEDRQEIFE